MLRIQVPKVLKVITIEPILEHFSIVDIDQMSTLDKEDVCTNWKPLKKRQVYDACLKYFIVHS